jgi:hypothetical protein
MKTHVRFLFWTFVSLTAVVLFFACKKEVSNRNSNIVVPPPGKANLSVMLVDGPLDFQKVLIDIQSIEVKVDTCKHNSDSDHFEPGDDDDHDFMSSGCQYWDTLKINPGIYDLLTLRNGVNALLGSGFLINGKIERIKLTLGTRDSVMVDSVMHQLNLIHSWNFVFINISKDHLDSLSSNNFQLFLDFDLDRSIIYFGGQYWLKPVLRPFGLHNTGEIEGTITPRHSHGMIKAYDATDTLFAWPEEHGAFEIRGLKPNTYTLFIPGANGYKDSTINSVVVKAGQETNVGTITLHQ